MNSVFDNYECKGQMNIFEVMNRPPNYPKEIAKGLKKHCEEWRYDWIEKLQDKKSPERFFQLFCRMTKTYYIDIRDDYYNVEFQKDGNVVIKRCGPDYDKRNEDAIISIAEVLEEL